MSIWSVRPTYLPTCVRACALLHAFVHACERVSLLASTRACRRAFLCACLALCVCLYVCASVCPICSSVSVSVCLCTCMSVCLFTYSPTLVSAYWPTYLRTDLPTDTRTCKKTDSSILPIAGDIFVHDRKNDIYHGVDNLETQSVERASATVAMLTAQREILRRRLQLPSDAAREARVDALMEDWTRFVPSSPSPFSDWYAVGLVDARTNEWYTPARCPHPPTDKPCVIQIVETRHGRDAHNVHSRLLTREMPRPFFLRDCHCLLLTEPKAKGSTTFCFLCFD